MLRQSNYGRLTEEEKAKLMIKLQTDKAVNLFKKLIVKNSVVRLKNSLQSKPKTRGISYEQ
jgi:hypothetical protein